MRPEKKPAVFDASVIAARLRESPAVVRELAPVINAVLDGTRPGIMSFVNAVEVQYTHQEILAKAGQNVFDLLKLARIEVAGTNKSQALLAAEAKRKVPDFSLGDAFAFALAAHRSGRLFTTDPAFDHPWVKERISLTLIRRR